MILWYCTMKFRLIGWWTRYGNSDCDRNLLRQTVYLLSISIRPQVLFFKGGKKPHKYKIFFSLRFRFSMQICKEAESLVIKLISHINVSFIIIIDNNFQASNKFHRNLIKNQERSIFFLFKLLLNFLLHNIQSILKHYAINTRNLLLFTSLTWLSFQKIFFCYYYYLVLPLYVTGW